MNAMKSAVSVAILSVAAATTAWAAPTTYTTEPNHTFVRFSYKHLGFSTQESRFNKVTGTVTFDAAAKSGSVDISIDTKSVDTGSDLFNGHIQGADFLDTANFGTATFKSTSVKFDGDRPVAIEGNLTLKGITKPVTLTVTDFKSGKNPQQKDAIGGDATAKISRTAFKMERLVPAVGDDVTLSIAIEAIAP
jgi:polyisoprenoid-binding protein YceI